MTQTAQKPSHYQAYETTNRRLERLRIQPVAGCRHAPSYAYLVNVESDERSGTMIELVYTLMTVKIAGRNMQPIRRAITDETCLFIQEYSPKRFAPPDHDAPIITQIEIVMSREYELLLAKVETQH